MIAEAWSKEASLIFVMHLRCKCDVKIFAIRLEEHLSGHVITTQFTVHPSEGFNESKCKTCLLLYS